MRRTKTWYGRRSGRTPLLALTVCARTNKAGPGDLQMVVRLAARFRYRVTCKEGQICDESPRVALVGWHLALNRLGKAIAPPLAPLERFDRFKPTPPHP